MIRIAPVAWVLSLAVAASGCLSSGATAPSKVVVPEDPTGLAKCRVQKSQASPLVTEWPASEKAHLEGLLSERAVVVSYSGCEMRLLDACHVPGSYKFKRTTIANDVIEIRNEDDLYAKVPLGAVSLEGELAASGRLAIKTTIAGQLRLDGGIEELPDGAACKDATHVVTALSVGAFELVSGGKVAGRAGIDVAGAGAGVKHASEESTLRSAGSSDSCGDTGEEAPSTDCSSPIQVFLVPLEHARRASDAEEAPSEAGIEEPVEEEAEEEEVQEPPPVKPAPRAKRPDRNAEPPPEKSVELHFDLPPDGGRWMLLSKSGELLCELPCVRRVANHSGMKLQLDADKKEDIKVVAVPEDLAYSPGRSVKAVPQPAYNNSIAAIGFYGGILAAVGGLAWWGAIREETCSEDAADPSCIGAYALMGGGAAIGLAGGIWWYSTRQDEELVMTLIDDRSARVTLAPGVLSASF